MGGAARADSLRCKPGGSGPAFLMAGAARTKLACLARFVLGATGCAICAVDVREAEAHTAADLDPDLWNELATGGRTSCSDRSACAFFVHPGKKNRLVIDFMGGGACWNEATCREGGFSGSLEPLRKAARLGYDDGIYDRENPENRSRRTGTSLSPAAPGTSTGGRRTSPTVAPRPPCASATEAPSTRGPSSPGYANAPTPEPSRRRTPSTPRGRRDQAGGPDPQHAGRTGRARPLSPPKPAEGPRRGARPPGCAPPAGIQRKHVRLCRRLTRIRPQLGCRPREGHH